VLHRVVMHSDMRTSRKVDVRLPGRGDSNSHGMGGYVAAGEDEVCQVADRIEKEFQSNNFDAMKFTTPHDLY